MLKAQIIERTLQKEWTAARNFWDSFCH